MTQLHIAVEPHPRPPPAFASPWFIAAMVVGGFLLGFAVMLATSITPAEEVTPRASGIEIIVVPE